jgi:hypothetical protein
MSSRIIESEVEPVLQKWSETLRNLAEKEIASLKNRDQSSENSSIPLQTKPSIEELEECWQRLDQSIIQLEKYYPSVSFSGLHDFENNMRIR